MADLHYPVTLNNISYLNGGKFKNPSTEYWTNPGTAENLFGFDIRGGGRYTGSRFEQVKTYSYIWLKGEKVLVTTKSDADATIDASYVFSNISSHHSHYIRFCRLATTSESDLSNGTRVADYVDYEGNRYICRKINNRV